MEDKSSLLFKEAKKEEEVVNLSKFDVQAFTDTQDFSWNLDNIKKEIKNLKKQKQKLNDEVLELNIKTEIPLSDDTVETLNNEGLL